MAVVVQLIGASGTAESVGKIETYKQRKCNIM